MVARTKDDLVSEDSKGHGFLRIRIEPPFLQLPDLGLGKLALESCHEGLVMGPPAAHQNLVGKLGQEVPVRAGDAADGEGSGRGDRVLGCQPLRQSLVIACIGVVVPEFLAPGGLRRDRSKERMSQPGL
ncbi:hypothetical protein D3C87_968550 [compost metagenome]